MHRAVVNDLIEDRNERLIKDRTTESARTPEKQAERERDATEYLTVITRCS